MDIFLDTMLDHEPLLLDRTVCLPLYSMWPSFGYFSTVYSGNSKRLNSEQSLISEHFW